MDENNNVFALLKNGSGVEWVETIKEGLHIVHFYDGTRFLVRVEELI